jgi:hypothetical protein
MGLIGILMVAASELAALEPALLFRLRQALNSWKQ